MTWLAWLAAEGDNLRAAMTWALNTGEVETAVRLGWALKIFWWAHGYHREGRRWMEALLARDLPPALRARAALVASMMAYMQGDHEAVERYSGEALALAREAGDAPCAGYALVILGLAAIHRAEYEAATTNLRASLPLLQEAGEDEQSEAALVPTFLGMIRLFQGDLAGAAPLFEEALALARRRGDRLNINVALYHLAVVAEARGDAERAAGLLAEGVRLSAETRDRAHLAHCLEGLAAVAGARGEAERAARLFGAAEAFLEVVGGPVYSYYRPDRARRAHLIAAGRTALGEPAFAAAWEEGRALTFEEAVAYALAHHGEGADPVG